MQELERQLLDSRQAVALSTPGKELWQAEHEVKYLKQQLQQLRQTSTAGMHH